LNDLNKRTLSSLPRHTKRTLFVAIVKLKKEKKRILFSGFLFEECEESFEAKMRNVSAFAGVLN